MARLTLAAIEAAYIRDDPDLVAPDPVIVALVVALKAAAATGQRARVAIGRHVEIEGV